MEMKKYKLGEIASIYNGSTPSTADKDNYDGDIVWATPKDLSDQQSKWFYKGARNITKKGFDSCSTQIIPANNILMSSRAPIGLFAINKVDCCTNQGFKNIVLDKSITDVDFMYYFLKYHVKEIEALGTGTTFKEVSKKSFESYEIEIPNLNIQKRIASILSALDQKIYLNRSINRDLEALAKQIYDYWFVQFDFPDENGKPYKSSGGKMVWNDDLKREIPEGWHVSKVEEIAQTYSGGTPNSTNEDYYKDGTIPWINSGELNNPIITTTTNHITPLGLDNSSAKLYPTNTILVALYGATAGKVSFLALSACSNQAVCGVIPQRGSLTLYLYHVLTSMYERFVTLSTGSARDNISQATIKSTQIIIPTDMLLIQFANIANVIMREMVNNQKEGEELIKQRNELLPLLMNGQVTVNPDLSVY